MNKRECTKKECEYYEELEAKEEYGNQYNGSYEASHGDYEGAILAEEEYNSGRIS